MSGKSGRRSDSGRGSSHSRIQNNSHASTSVPLQEEVGSNSKPRGPKATAEQLRLAELLYPINSKDDVNDARLLASVRQLVECAGCTEDFAAMALHEAGGELERAAELLLDKDRPWNISSSAKAKKKSACDEAVTGAADDVSNAVIGSVVANVGFGGFQRERTRHHDRGEKDNGSFRHDRRGGSNRSNSRNVPSENVTAGTGHVAVESNFQNGVDSTEEAAAQRLPPRLTRGSRHAVGCTSSRGRGRGRGVTHFRGKRNGNVSVAAPPTASDALLWDDNLDLSIDADSEWTGQGSLTFTNSLHSAVASDAPISVSPTPAVMECLVGNSALPLQPITTISSFGEPSDSVGGLQSPTGCGAITTSSVSLLSGSQQRNYNGQETTEPKPQKSSSSTNAFQELLGSKNVLYSSQQPQMANAMHAYKKLATEQLKNSLGIGEFVVANGPQAVVSQTVIPTASLDPLSGAKSPVKSKPPPPSKIPRGPVEMPRRGLLSTNGGSGLDFGFGDPAAQMPTTISKPSEKLSSQASAAAESTSAPTSSATTANAAAAELMSIEVAPVSVLTSEPRISTTLGTSFSSKPSSVSSGGSASVLQVNRSSLEESNISPSSSFAVAAPASTLSLPLNSASASMSAGGSAQSSYQTTPNKQNNYSAANQTTHYKMESSGLMGAYSAAGGSSFKETSESNSNNGYSAKSGQVSAAVPAATSLQNDLHNSNVIANSSYQQQQQQHHHQASKNIAPGMGNAGTSFHQTAQQPTPPIHQQLYNQVQTNPGLLGSMFPDGSANAGTSQGFSFNQLFDMQNLMQSMYMHRMMQDAATAMASGGIPSPQGQPADSASKQQDSRQQHSNNTISQQQQQQQQHATVTQHQHHHQQTQQQQQQQQAFMNPQAGMYNYYGNTAYPYQFMSGMANLIQQQMQQAAPSQQTSGVTGQSLGNSAPVATNSPATNNKQNAFGYGSSSGVSGQVAYTSEDVTNDYKYGTKDLNTGQAGQAAQTYTKYSAAHHNAHEKHASAGAATAVGMHPSISAGGYGQAVSYGAHHYATLPPQILAQSMLPAMQAQESASRNNMAGQQVGGASKSNLVKPSSGGNHALNAHNHYGGWTSYN